MPLTPKTPMLCFVLTPLMACMPSQKSASALAATGVTAQPATPVNLMTSVESGDQVAVLPSYVAEQTDGSLRYWLNVRVTGKDDESHGAKIAAMRLALALKTGVPSASIDKAAFAGRVAGFFIEGEKLRRVDAVAGETSVASAKTNLDGIATLAFSAPTAGKLTVNGAATDGGILRIPVHGVSVVSDVDDTIKVTNVLDQQELLRNTFFRPFEAVPGMAAAYRAWAAKPGTTFHYVSKSPWQLFEPLRAFFAKQEFPAGTFHLKSKAFGILDLEGFFAEPNDFKTGVIGQLLSDAPERRFVLVGDSGEADPEIYGELARQNGARIEAIFIRNVTNLTEEDARLAAAFAGVPRTKWKLFKDASGLAATPL